MFTDIYVSSADAPLRGQLGPAESYLSLMHLDATLKDVGAAARKAGKTEATLVGAPVGASAIVALQDGFGYRLNGDSGIELPWSVLPAGDGILRPFTISLGLSFDEFAAGAAILTAKSTDGALALALSVGETAQGPRATLTVAGAQVLEIPWTGSDLQQGRRYLVSLTIIPRAKSLTAIWFLDGDQISALTADLVIPVLKPEGKALIGGAGGFKGVIDEFGVYFKDEQGRPSPDPGLYHRARQQALEDRLIIAEGFDGVFMPKEFILNPRGDLDSGSLTVIPDSSAELPPLPADDARAIDFSITLSPISAKAAVLQVSWEGSEEPAITVPILESEGTLRFIKTTGATAIILPMPAGDKSISLAAAPTENSNLIIRIINPKDAKSPLIITQILAVAALE